MQSLYSLGVPGLGPLDHDTMLHCHYQHAEPPFGARAQLADSAAAAAQNWPF